MKPTNFIHINLNACGAIKDSKQKRGRQGEPNGKIGKGRVDLESENLILFSALLLYCCVLYGKGLASRALVFSFIK